MQIKFLSLAIASLVLFPLGWVQWQSHQFSWTANPRDAIGAQVSPSGRQTSDSPTSNSRNGESLDLAQGNSSPALTYPQRVEILRQQATAIAAQKPPRLTILLGDSLSLVFPSDLLLAERSWLNQSISGENSTGLLKRLTFLKSTQPETIFVLIGINDLLKGETAETLLANQRQIIQELRKNHPKAQIIVQSLLPHQTQEKATWEGRDRLQRIPNPKIREINRQLRAIAWAERVYFLDLHPLFTDKDGNLRAELTTDGLHLSERGYWVWRTALQLFSQMELEPR